MSKMANILSVSPTRVPSGGALGKVYQSAPVLLLPLIGLLMFLAVWNGVAKSIDTSLGQFPGPAQVWEQAGVLVDEHNAQREKSGCILRATSAA